MNIQASSIPAVTGGRESAPGAPDRTISAVITDSRSLFEPRSTVFFALRTPGNDGRRYIGRLYERGVRCFVADSRPDDLPPDARLVVVPDAAEALRALGAAVRSTLRGRVAAVAGSAGKTVVKEWIYSMVETAGTPADRSPRSYNSSIGVPMAICGMDPDARLAVVEAGISRASEMERLRAVIRPDTVILTSLTAEHDEGFSSRAQKAAEKVSLASGAKSVIYPAECPEYSESVRTLDPAVARRGWSLEPDTPAWLHAKVEHPDSSHTLIHWDTADGLSGMARLSFAAGPHDIADALSAITFMGAEGYAPELIARGAGRLYPIATRLDVTEGVNGCSIVCDSFTSDFDSLPSALDFMARRATEQRSATLIVSDMPHRAASDADMFARLLSLCRLAGVSRLICVGPGLYAQRETPAPGLTAEFYASRRQFESQVSPSDFSSEIILLKGAPEYDFSAVAERLEARQHETVLEVDLDAAVRNFNYFRSLLPQTTGLIAMVKAGAYGAGSIELARTLQAQGAAYLAVAVIDEGIELRRAGITMPIMIMNPRSFNYKALFAAGLEPVIYNPAMLADVVAEARRSGISRYPVHIKLDTGMHRTGFTPEQIAGLVDTLSATDAIRVHSAFSHLATADMPEMDEYTDAQIARFTEMTESLAAGLPYSFMRHILNTAGIIRRPEAHFDMARLGIGLYGVNPVPGGTSLDTVSTLRTVISHIRTWPAGEAVGYGRRGLLKSERRIATIPIGYADGLDRRLSCGAGSVYVAGKLAPIVGNICMDATMIDVTGIECSEGSHVEIFGPHIRVEELAERLGTIPYEILTSVSPRVKRIYYRE